MSRDVGWEGMPWKWKGKREKKKRILKFTSRFLYEYRPLERVQRSDMSHVCSFLLATAQRAERLLDVPKRNGYEWSRPVWRLIYGERNVLLTTDVPIVKQVRKCPQGVTLRAHSLCCLLFCEYFQFSPKTVATSLFFTSCKPAFFQIVNCFSCLSGWH